MCGIAGFADFTRRSTAQTLAGMTACMPHRGPDGSGDYLADCGEATIGLGHRRLSIIDLSHAADQPMHYAGLSIVFNGEIYNYAEIRETLVGLGHSFKTQSDTEVILHAWKEWGEDAIHHWRGMFAIVLLDAEAGEIICIRDRAGVKPLHYAYHDGLFLFGSELKNLMAHPHFGKEIDPQAVAMFMQYGYVPGQYSIFRNAAKLQAGHLLRLNLRTTEVRTRQYWSVYDSYNQPKLDIPLPEAVAETERILQEAFEYRMVADVPVGVFLSGGYDSTCVTALLQKDRTEKLKTFTIGTTDNALDEAPFARAIAAHLGTDHTEYYCTAQEALDIIPALPQYYDEPFADSSAIPTILVSRAARQKVTVALSADAGDEIFAGYSRYDFIRRYSDRLRAIPGPLRGAGAALMGAVAPEKIPVLGQKPQFRNRYTKLRNLLKDPSPAQLLKDLSSAFSDAELARMMTATPRLPETAHISTALRPEHNDPLSYMMAIDWETYMVDDILQKVDRATMSTSLEGREPFLDQHIIEWAARLPADYKIHDGTKKFILREIVHRYIPKAMMDRPKMGFGIPVEQWLRAELKPLVDAHLQPSALRAHGLFREEAVAMLLREFYAGISNNHLQVWHLLMFQMWYQKWMAS